MAFYTKPSRTNLVNRIIHTSSQRYLERRDKNTIYKQLSLDEKAFQKEHQYVSVLCDPVAGEVIDIAKDRTKKSCKLLLDNALSAFQKSKVETISLLLCQKQKKYTIDFI